MQLQNTTIYCLKMQNHSNIKTEFVSHKNLCLCMFQGFSSKTFTTPRISYIPSPLGGGNPCPRKGVQQFPHSCHNGR